MPDDPRASSAATAEKPAATPAPAPQEQAPDAAESHATGQAVPEQDWRAFIDTAPVDDLRAHPRVAGIVGQMVDQAMRKWRAEQQAEVSARAQAEAQRRMLEKAKADPYGFAQEFLTDAQAREAQGQIEKVQADLSRQEANRFATAIGSAFQGVTEWKEMSQAEFEELARAVGQDDDPIAVFQKFLPGAIDKVAAKRFDKLYAERHAKDLEKEVEAAVKERLNEMRKKAPRPELRRAEAAPADFDPSTLSPEEFTRWYEGPDGPLGRL